MNTKINAPTPHTCVVTATPRGFSISPDTETCTTNYSTFTLRSNMVAVTLSGLIPIDQYEDLNNPSTVMAAACTVNTFSFRKWAKVKFTPGGKNIWIDMMQEWICSQVCLFRIIDKPDIWVSADCFGKPAVIGVLEDGNNFTEIVDKVMDQYSQWYWSRVEV